MPYYTKEYALRQLTQLYSFTSLKVIQNHTHTEKEINVQDNIHQEKQNQKQTKTQNNTKTPQKDLKNTSKRKKKQENDRKNFTTRTSRKIRT